MDSCEEHVIIACGLYILSEEGKPMKQIYWISNVFWSKEEEGKFHTMFGRLKKNMKKGFQYFRMGISKFENFKEFWRFADRASQYICLTI